MLVGVLALQGAFIEHESILHQLGVETIEIRKKDDLNQELDGLILPGGESTTMGKLLRELELLEPIRRKIEKGLPVYGTCAGMILLADEISNDERTHLATMPIRVQRNAYGRQLGSFVVRESFGQWKVPMVFIRAPYIEKVSKGTTVLATVADKIVAARYQNQLVTAFHPELTEDMTVHNYFLKMISLYRKDRICYTR